MAGETAANAEDLGMPIAPEEQQKLWDEVAAERGNADASKDVTEKAEPEAEETTAEAKPAEAAEAKPEPKPADPFEGLSPELKARLSKIDELDKVVAEVPKLRQSLKTAEGRLASMASELDQAKRAAKAVETAPSAAQIAAAAKSTAKWDALKSDFPEWAQATEEFVSAQLSTIPQPEKPAPGLSQEQIDALVKQRVDAVRRELEFEKVSERYENWRDLVKTPEFVAWFQMQDAQTKALADSPRGRDAVAMLDLYHKAKPAEAVQQERQSRLAAAASAKPGKPGQVSKSVDDMTPAELWEYERKRAAADGKRTGLHY